MDDQGNEDRFAEARRQMVVYDLKGRDITDVGVLEAIGQIRREEFVMEKYQSQAYADGPLPIGLGQTISQPYIVGLMSEELRIGSDSEVLEIGTGSGYQTSVLCRLAKKVYTIERCGQLSEAAVAVLGRLGVRNVEFYIGDGSCGWPGEKEFDRIIITAGVPQIPEPLKAQLKEGGLLVAPIGGGSVQELVVCEKKGGQITERAICPVRFVKLFGKYGFEEEQD